MISLSKQSVWYCLTTKTRRWCSTICCFRVLKYVTVIMTFAVFRTLYGYFRYNYDDVSNSNKCLDCDFNRTTDIVLEGTYVTTTEESYGDLLDSSTKQTHYAWHEQYVEYVTKWCDLEEKLPQHRGVTDLCPCIPDGIPATVNVNMSHLLHMSWTEVESSLPDLTSGHWKPKGCTRRRKVAVIIPYRDREPHLRAFLAHTIPIWQKQLIEFKIFVVEQYLPYMFNKAAMMNIGFLEARGHFTSNCILFHDVDLLVENNGNMVICGDNPTHVTPYIDKYDYRLPYVNITGGGFLLTPTQFLHINGYSNTFFGWGGEDDDFGNRIRTQDYQIYRAPIEVARFTSIKHTHDDGNPYVGQNIRGFKVNTKRYKTDGVKVSKDRFRYHIRETKDYKLYTWIQVDLIAPIVKLPHRHAFLKRPDAQYTVMTGECTTNTTGNSTKHNARSKFNTVHLMSRISCQSLCNAEAGCVGFNYSEQKEKDSFCVLLHEDQCHRLAYTEPKELHIKKEHLQLLYY